MNKRITGLLTALTIAATPIALPAKAADTDPTYRVYMARDGTSYTAEVTLENLAATYGTFGIKYDPTLFRYEGMTIADGLEVKLTHDEEYGAAWSNDNGYKLFVWQAGGYDDTVYDTTAEPKPIATMRFTLTGDEEDIMRASFGVMPWNETAAAQAYAETLPKNNPIYEPNAFYEVYWRYTDEQNEPFHLGRGRLEKDKAIVNGVQTGGFYQAAVNADLDDEEENAYFYDVKTVFKYGFPVNDPILTLHVVDKLTGEPIEGAQTLVYDPTDIPLGLRQTDESGNTLYPEAICDGSTYTYTAAANGYRPVPLTGYKSDRPAVVTEQGKSTIVTVEMERAVYHVPEAKDPKLKIGGERYGYNGYDYHFRIEPEPGYRITKYPAKATVTINGEATRDIPVDAETELFTLTADRLYQAPLTEEQLTSLGYDDVKPQPDENGYRSYNMIIDFDDYTVEEVNYTVTAYTSENGSAEYTYKTDELAPTVDEAHKKLIRTTAQNRKTGEFKFTADEGYKVWKTYINGLEIHTYDDETEFTYTFGEVEEDNNITVIFYDGKNEPKDRVITLVVGDYGRVSVTEPEEGPGLTATRKTYLNPTGDLVFTAEGMDGYVLHSIVVEDGTARTEDILYPDDPTHYYRYEPPENGHNKTVYVNFRNQKAEDSPTIYVKSYVAEGKGVIDPCGIQICGKGDEPSFLLTAADGEWRTRGVALGDFDLNRTDEVDFPERPKTAAYAMQPLTGSVSVGAIFTGKGYWLKGHIDLGQATNISDLLIKSGAEVTLTRADGLSVTVQSTPSRHDSIFAAEIAEGVWTITVRKPGYVKYTITDYAFEAPANETDITEFADGKKIVPLIGSTRTGTSVSLLDAAIIKAVQSSTADDADKIAADVDDDGKTDAKDMYYVLFNYGKRAKAKTYAEFLGE